MLILLIKVTNWVLLLNNIKVCDKCRTTNVKTLVPRLKKLDPKAIIEIGCFNFCGIGRDKSICILNDKPVIAENEDSLIKEVKVRI